MRRKKMNGEVAIKEVITLLALSRDVLLELMMENEAIDNGLLHIYCHALIGLGELLEDTIVSIAAYCGSYLDYEVGCEGTD